MYSGAAVSEVPTVPSCHRLAPFNPVTPDVIEALLSPGCAGLVLGSPASAKRPLFLDIGSGDGRLLEAVHERTGCFCAGIEYDGALHDKALARLLAKRDSAGGDSTEGPYAIFCEDAVTFDYKGKLPRNPSVIYCYLVPAGMKLMRDTLLNLLKEAQSEYEETTKSMGGGGSTLPKPLLVTYIFSLPDADITGLPGDTKPVAEAESAVLSHRIVRTSRGLPLHVYSFD
jgi:hypothetical protein